MQTCSGSLPAAVGPAGWNVATLVAVAVPWQATASGTSSDCTARGAQMDQLLPCQAYEGTGAACVVAPLFAHRRPKPSKHWGNEVDPFSVSLPRCRAAHGNFLPAAF